MLKIGKSLHALIMLAWFNILKNIMTTECPYDERLWHYMTKSISFIHGVDLIMCYKLFFYRDCVYKNEMGL